MCLVYPRSGRGIGRALQSRPEAERIVTQVAENIQRAEPTEADGCRQLFHPRWVTTAPIGSVSLENT